MISCALVLSQMSNADSQAPPDGVVAAMVDDSVVSELSALLTV